MRPSQPPEPPESIFIDRLEGLNNARTPERLRVGELSIAQNIVLDDAKQARVRPGFTQHDTSSYHSGRRIAGRTFIVRDGVLSLLAAGPTLTPLATVGADPVSYTAIGDEVFASSISWSGRISPSNIVSAWGIADDPGQWISPVQTPTATMGAISGRQLIAPPLASIVEEHKGRIYLAVGNVLWFTELFLPAQVDLHRNFIQFERPITLLHSADTGLYVGTDRELFFLAGTATVGMSQTPVVESGVVPGSVVKIPATLLAPPSGEQLAKSGDAALFLTADGICAAMDRGEVQNLTQGRVVFPAVSQAAAMHRHEAGNSQYVVTGDDGKTFSLNTRTRTVTEHTNYAFTTYAQVAASYFGGAANGLFPLSGADDMDTAIPVRMRSGLMRFGGARLSRLKAAYMTARSESAMGLAIETGEGTRYEYAVTTREMRTMRVYMGKGQRATQFLFDLTGTALDLDLLELVPLVVGRRV